MMKPKFRPADLSPDHLLKPNGDSLEANVYRNKSKIGSPVVIGREAT
jgi:hypothetical protein